VGRTRGERRLRSMVAVAAVVAALGCGGRLAVQHDGLRPQREAHAAPERLALEKSFYARLLDHTTCYLFNSGVAGADKLKEIVG